MLELVFDEAIEKMEKTISVLHHELSRVRTGRASVALVENLRVDYYGTMTPIPQMSTVAVPESRLLTISPWDATLIPAVEKAILKSDLGLNPTNDGKMIRISIPPLSEQRRKDLVKVVSKICEEQKVSVRNIRREANENLKNLKKDGEISEDDAFRGQDKIQKITDEHIKQIDEICAKKEKEILEF